MADLQNVLEQLRTERDQTQTQLYRLDQAIAALEGVAKRASAGSMRPRRTLSPAARQRIAEAQRRRWAKARAKKAAKPTRTRRALSPAARARIVAAQKRRWAKVRAQGRSRTA